MNPKIDFLNCSLEIAKNLDMTQWIVIERLMIKGKDHITKAMHIMPDKRLHMTKKMM